ncbi:hypothetical protein B0H11DRAFT_1909082 [Mycena galericulata]|nr:hypothetical protein B0H11DRAFT_1909082 [Mycena galericulata]
MIKLAQNLNSKYQRTNLKPGSTVRQKASDPEAVKREIAKIFIVNYYVNGERLHVSKFRGKGTYMYRKGRGSKGGRSEYNHEKEQRQNEKVGERRPVISESSPGAAVLGMETAKPATRKTQQAGERNAGMPNAGPMSGRSATRVWDRDRKGGVRADRRSAQRNGAAPRSGRHEHAGRGAGGGWVSWEVSHQAGRAPSGKGGTTSGAGQSQLAGGKRNKRVGPRNVRAGRKEGGRATSREGNARTTGARPCGSVRARGRRAARRALPVTRLEYGEEIRWGRRTHRGTGTANGQEEQAPSAAGQHTGTAPNERAAVGGWEAVAGSPVQVSGLAPRERRGAPATGCHQNAPNEPMRKKAPAAFWSPGTATTCQRVPSIEEERSRGGGAGGRADGRRRRRSGRRQEVADPVIGPTINNTCTCDFPFWQCPLSTTIRAHAAERLQLSGIRVAPQPRKWTDSHSVLSAGTTKLMRIMTDRAGHGMHEEDMDGGLYMLE